MAKELIGRIEMEFDLPELIGTEEQIEEATYNRRYLVRQLIPIVERLIMGDHKTMRHYRKKYESGRWDEVKYKEEVEDHKSIILERIMTIHYLLEETDAAFWTMYEDCGVGDYLCGIEERYKKSICNSRDDAFLMWNTIVRVLGSKRSVEEV